MRNQEPSARTLRIAHLTATFPPYQGGTGNVCYHNAHQLALRGHEVHVFTAAMSGAATLEVRDGFTIHRLQPLLRVGNAPLLPGVLPVLRGFDVIHLHFPFILGAELARLAAWIYRTPLVLSFHNDLIGNGIRARIFSLYQSLSAQVTVRTAACLCAVSIDHYQSSLLRRSLDELRPPAVELPNGVDIEHFSPAGAGDTIRQEYGIPAEAKLLLFVAALDRAHHFKGLGTLLQALQSLPPDVWLLVVGDGDLRLAYERDAADLGISERVVFAGSMDHERTPPFFRGADLTVLPSSPPESFGLVLIESLACGSPVVASDIPGVRTVVEHGGDGLLVRPNDPVKLAEAIQRILGDHELHRVMGLRGRARVEARYSWERAGARLEAIYGHVLKPARVHRASEPARGQ